MVDTPHLRCGSPTAVRVRVSPLVRMNYDVDKLKEAIESSDSMQLAL